MGGQMGGPGVGTDSEKFKRALARLNFSESVPTPEHHMDPPYGPPDGPYGPIWALYGPPKLKKQTRVKMTPNQTNAIPKH